MYANQPEPGPRVKNTGAVGDSSSRSIERVLRRGPTWNPPHVAVTLSVVKCFRIARAGPTLRLRGSTTNSDRLGTVPESKSVCSSR